MNAHAQGTREPSKDMTTGSEGAIAPHTALARRLVLGDFKLPVVQCIFEIRDHGELKKIFDRGFDVDILIGGNFEALRGLATRRRLFSPKLKADVLGLGGESREGACGFKSAVLADFE